MPEETAERREPRPVGVDVRLSLFAGQRGGAASGDVDVEVSDPELGHLRAGLGRAEVDDPHEQYRTLMGGTR
jgi:hypothetical protein